MLTTLLSCLVVALGLGVATWLVSVVVRDASIVDLLWGVFFVAMTIMAAIVGDLASAGRRYLLVVLVAVWGFRLAGYLAWRNLGGGEDRRYTAMRARRANFTLWSLPAIFLSQAVLAFIVALPLLLALGSASARPVGVVAMVGVVVWAVGLFFEAVGDWQLARFKARPESKGQVMDQGLWKYTRHPNYFGDFCIWWGLFFVAAETRVALWGIVGPLLMTVLLTRVSGKDLLERTITRRRPGYAGYVARTNGFFPGRPKH